MTLEEALENLETYGADLDRWPQEMHADYESYLAISPEFSKRHDEIREMDAALSGWEQDDEVGINVGEESDSPPSDASDPSRPDDVDLEEEPDDEDEDTHPSDEEEGDEDDAPLDFEFDDDGDEEQEDPDFDGDDEDEQDEGDGDGDTDEVSDGDIGTGSSGPSPSGPPNEDEDSTEPSDPKQIPDMDDLLDEQEPPNNPTSGRPSVDPDANEDDIDEDAEPLDIDLEDQKDLDDSLSEILADAMQGAFDGSIQTDYTRDFDVIENYSSGEPGEVYDTDKFEARVRKQTGVMQKDLQRMIVARSQSFHVGGYRSGKLNAPALHRVAAGDERIFRRKHVTQTLATAISLVVDCSGSMSGEKIKVAMEAAWAFADILDRLKIPNEVIGFSTTMFPGGYDDYHKILPEVEKMSADTGLPMGSIRWVPTYMPVFKAFGERFGPEQKKRMVRMVETEEGMGANNDAMALQYASYRLMQRTEPRKIMIVFSDGQPTDGAVHTHIIGNTMKMVIKKLAQQGVETIGIGIQDESVRAYYPKNMVLHKVAQLPGLVMKELRKLLLA